jgi:hypothetical protein
VFDVLAAPLVGSLVALEPLDQRHLADLRAAASDPAWYSVLDREWPGVRANLEARLAAR